MTDWPILSIVTFLPLVGALLIICFVIRGDDEAAQRNIRMVALRDDDRHLPRLAARSGANFDTSNPGFQFVEKRLAGSASSTTRWASTASRCCSSS